VVGGGDERGDAHPIAAPSNKVLAVDIFA
jgi:hypothetical protein